MNKSIIFAAVIFMFFCGLTIFQTAGACDVPEQKWLKAYEMDGTEWGFSVQQTSDSGYIITGLIYSNNTDNNNGLLLIKTDSNGHEQWKKTYFEGGAGYCVQQTSDCGFIITGAKGGVNESLYILLFKTDINGNELWNKTFGKANLINIGYSVKSTRDNGYIIIGVVNGTQLNSSAFFQSASCNLNLIKTDANGNELWNKTFGGAYGDFGYSVNQIRDGGYIITGTTQSYGTNERSDVWLIKTDENGNELWNKTFGENYYGEGLSVQQTNDGGYIISGILYNGRGSILIKTDENGNEKWKKTWEDGDRARTVKQLDDGGYILATSRLGDAWLIKVDQYGNEEWNKTYGEEEYIENLLSLEKTIDDGFIITGFRYKHNLSNSDIFLIKIGPKHSTIDTSFLYPMLVISMIVVILFCLPIAYYWRKKWFS